MKQSTKLALLFSLVSLMSVSLFTACDDFFEPQEPGDTLDIVTDIDDTSSTSTPSDDSMEIATDPSTDSETETHVHSFGNWTTVKEASCTEDGEQERVCGCGEKEIQTLNMKGHSEVTDEAVAPTCTDTGLTEGKHCGVCHAILLAQTEIEKLEHTDSDWIVDSPATCTENGSRHKECTGCGGKTARETLYAQGHKEGDWILDKSSTCVERGSRHKECSVCQKTVKTESLLLVDHTDSDWIVDTPATCTDNGSRHKECTVCKAGTARETLYAQGHKEGDWILDKSSTCVERGSRHKECSVCHETVKTESLLLVDHTDSDWIVDTPATCTENGSRHKECTGCGGKTARETLYAQGHKEVVDPAITPTCAETGLTQGKHCSVCQTVLIKQEVIPVSHTWTDTYQSDNAAHWKKCTLCGTNSDPIAHDMESDGYCQTCHTRVEGIDGVLYAISSDGTYAEVIDYIGNSTEVVIAAEYEGVPVTHIADRAFESQNITSCMLPDSLISIGSYAFSNCESLLSITIPNNVTNIGSYAFKGCEGLTEITIPDGVTDIGSGVLGGCRNLETVTLPFLGTNRTANGSLLDFFYITQDSYVPESLKTVIITGGTGIGKHAFWVCNFLENIILPDSITSIGEEAFYGCTRLSFNKYEKGKYLGTPDNPYFAYIGPSTQSLTYTLHEDTKVIADTAFSGCSKLQSIVIPDGITAIGYKTFYECSNLRSIKLPDSITSIGDNAFSRCSNLTDITIPDGVTSIGNNAFFGCGSLPSIRLPHGITSIGNYTFFNCGSLASINIPDSVTSIGYHAFGGCRRLTSITIPVGVTYIDNSTFSDCVGLTSISIPLGVTDITSGAFYGCENLASIVIPDSVTSIGPAAFYDCLRLNAVYYTGTATDWEAINIDANNENLTETTIYHYSETQPTTAGNYWHYVNGIPTKW